MSARGVVAVATCIVGALMVVTSRPAAAKSALFEIFLNPPANGIAQLRIMQGPTVVTRDCAGDCTLVFDVTR